MDDGERGSRHEHAGALLARACGAEAGLVVNNNAAAVLLVARRRWPAAARSSCPGASWSRSAAASACPRSWPSRAAGWSRWARPTAPASPTTQPRVAADTALVLKVHASNYRMVGLHRVGARRRARVARPAGDGRRRARGCSTTRRRGCPRRPAWLRDEPGIRQASRPARRWSRSRATSCSAARRPGVIVGRADARRRARGAPARPGDARRQADARRAAGGRASPTSRATRRSIPLWRMATAPLDGLRARAEAIARGRPGGQGGRHRGGGRRRLAAGARRSRRSASRSRCRRRPGALAAPARARRRRPDRGRRRRLRPAHGRPGGRRARRSRPRRCIRLTRRRRARRRDRRPRRPRQVDARPRAHGHRSRPVPRGEGARADDRPRLRVHARCRRVEEVGFVDVPGHVRFIKNMLAGVGAVDVAMLVVAANEGWMPQSEEHLRILELLGVQHGLGRAHEGRPRRRRHPRARPARARRAPGAVGARRCAGRRVRRAVGPRARRRARRARRGARGRAASPSTVTGRGCGSTACSRPRARARSSPARWPAGRSRVDDEVVVGAAQRGAHGSARIETSHHQLDAAAPGTRVALNLAGSGSSAAQCAGATRSSEPASGS